MTVGYLVLVLMNVAESLGIAVAMRRQGKQIDALLALVELLELDGRGNGS